MRGNQQSVLTFYSVFGRDFNGYSISERRIYTNLWNTFFGAVRPLISFFRAMYNIAPAIFFAIINSYSYVAPTSLDKKISTVSLSQLPHC